MHKNGLGSKWYGLVMIAGLITATSVMAESELWRWQLDVQGRSLYSRYNFTDVKHPYEGIDTYMEIKPTFWFDRGQQIGLYASFLPVHTTEREFWWQKNLGYGIGLQYYPAGNDIAFEPLRGFRLFAQQSWRHYYDEPEGSNPEDRDLAVGFDYYYDTIYKTNSLWAIAAYAYGAYRDTNFSLDDYNAFLTYGNIQFGPTMRVGSTLAMGYGVLDWSYSPSYSERWWENALRAGAGFRVHPWGAINDAPPRQPYKAELLRRFTLFAEVLNNVAWLGDSAPDEVETTDYRIGLSFSTGGFYR